MQSAGDIRAFIAWRPDMIRLLQIVEALGLPDCWIGAGL